MTLHFTKVKKLFISYNYFNIKNTIHCVNKSVLLIFSLLSSNLLAKYVLQDRVLLRWPEFPELQMKADGSKQSIMGSIGEFLLKIYAVLKILFKLSRVGTGNIHCLKGM